MIRLSELLRTLHGTTCVRLRVDATELDIDIPTDNEGNLILTDSFYEYQWPKSPLAKAAADWQVAGIDTAPNRITAENEYDLLVHVMSPKFLDQLRNS